jgi:hypothetical protein
MVNSSSDVTGPEAVALRKWRRRYFTSLAIGTGSWCLGFFLPDIRLASVVWELGACAFIVAGVIVVRDPAGISADLGAMNERISQRFLGSQRPIWRISLVGWAYIVLGVAMAIGAAVLFLGWTRTPS